MGELYLRFRGSNAFLWFLAVYIGAWIVAHHVTGFDPDFAILNLTLSCEASLSVALLMVDAAKADKARNKQLEYMLHTMEAMQSLLETQNKMLTRGETVA